MSTPSDLPKRTPSHPPGDVTRLLPRITGRRDSLFQRDIDAHEAEIRARIEGRRVLVTGAAGSIGSATVKQLLRYGPSLLAAIDISENTMVELVRDVRGGPDSDAGEVLRTYIVDFASALGEHFVRDVGPFDLVLHFAAMKHVRSERDIFSLSRLLWTNVLGVDRFLAALKRHGRCDVFAVSSDKACRPASLMGASKRLMERVVFWHGGHAGALLREGTAGRGKRPALPRAVCTRFANVAFSDGSLLAGFLARLRNRQPLAGPSDVRRYFITDREAGQLCLLTAALAKTGQIFVPRLDPSADLKSFAEIAEILLDAQGYRPRWHDSEEAARRSMPGDLAEGHYPCFFAPSDTSGEKRIEEFVAHDERTGELLFKAIDVIVDSPAIETLLLREVLASLAAETTTPDVSTGKARLVEHISRVVGGLRHTETERNLDQKM